MYVDIMTGEKLSSSQVAISSVIYQSVRLSSRRKWNMVIGGGGGGGIFILARYKVHFIRVVHLEVITIRIQFIIYLLEFVCPCRTKLQLLCRVQIFRNIPHGHSYPLLLSVPRQIDRQMNVQGTEIPEHSTRTFLPSAPIRTQIERQRGIEPIFWNIPRRHSYPLLLSAP